MDAFFEKEPPAVTLTAFQAGCIFADCDAGQQAAFLRGMCDTVDKWPGEGGWSIQCRSIIKAMRDGPCITPEHHIARIALMLERLAEHLREQPDAGKDGGA